MLGLLALLAACGPSAKEIRSARDARYTASRGQILDEVIAVVQRVHGVADAGYGSTSGEPTVLSTGRWYAREGVARQSKVGDEVGVYDGDIMLELIVRVIAEGDAFQVTVTPRAERFKSGHSSTDKLEAGDPRMPGWVEGQVDDLQVQLHDRLKAFGVVTPAPST